MNWIIKGVHAVVVMSAALTWTSQVSALTFQAELNGANARPNPVTTDAFGSASLILNDDKTELTISITIIGLGLADISAAHIHRGGPDVPGPVVFGFIGPNSDKDGERVIKEFGNVIKIVTIVSQWDLSEGNGTTLNAELANLFNDNLYINVHTPTHPSGEIRGQIVPEPASLALIGLGIGTMILKRKA